MRTRPSAAILRLNTALTIVLLVAIAVLANRIARDHLAVRRDFSEDGLYAISPATLALLGELDDVLQVEGYFTGEASHPAAQVAIGRVLEILRELQVASGSRLEFRHRDPNRSSEARLEAARLSIQPAPISSFVGTAQVSEHLYLGLALRYRGREAVLPFVLPQNLEYAFSSSLRRLQRDVAPTVGLVAEGEAFAEASEVLSISNAVRPVQGLDVGEPVPADVDVLLVARPKELHPRAAFAIDQFVQRGGRAILLVDHVEVDVQSGAAIEYASGLEPVLRAWNVRLAKNHVWDQQCVAIPVRDARNVKASFDYPYWINVSTDGMHADHPVTASLPAVMLRWAHPILEGEAPEGATRTELLSSSERSWAVPTVAGFALDAAATQAQEAELLVRGDAGRLTLAVALAGRLPSAFEGGAPAPLDPLVEAERDAARREAAALGNPAPIFEDELTDETVVSGQHEAQVVVVADADWITGGKLFAPENKMLLENLVDWMVLETELMALRSRRPAERRIADFLREEREARNVPTLGIAGMSATEEQRATRLAGEAARAASRRRWTHMAGAALGSLVLYGALAGALAALRRRDLGVPR